MKDKFQNIYNACCEWWVPKWVERFVGSNGSWLCVLEQFSSCLLFCLKSTVVMRGTTVPLRYQFFLQRYIPWRKFPVPRITSPQCMVSVSHATSLYIITNSNCHCQHCQHIAALAVKWDQNQGRVFVSVLNRPMVCHFLPNRYRFVTGLTVWAVICCIYSVCPAELLAYV